MIYIIIMNVCSAICTLHTEIELGDKEYEATTKATQTQDMHAFMVIIKVNVMRSRSIIPHHRRSSLIGRWCILLSAKMQIVEHLGVNGIYYIRYQCVISD